MENNVSWQDFCALYYDVAHEAAVRNLEKLRARLGGWDERVDESYVVDDSVLSALEKAYVSFDPVRGAKITTYLTNIIHNQVVDNLKKEIREASRKVDLENTAKCDTIQEVCAVLPQKTVDHLMARLIKAVAKLSHADQVILKFYLEDASTYIEKAVGVLHVSENSIRIRRCRIFSRLPALMGVTSDEYAEMHEFTALSGTRKCRREQYVPKNPLYPEMDSNMLVDLMLEEMGRWL